MSWPPPHPPNACRSRRPTPLYVLYASGTTGVPKGVVRDNGGRAVALHWSVRNLYGVKPDKVMYEEKPVGTPDAGAFWRVIEQHRVRVFFTAPTAFVRSSAKTPTAA